MGGRGKAVFAVLLVSLVAAAPTASAQANRDCFWQGGSRSANIAYPDLGARYWVSTFPLPPGAELILKGTYPHARYFSFNVYDGAAQPTDGLADQDIVPDPGSANPFLAGANRDGAARSYTVRVVAGPKPAQREPNTIYVDAAGLASPYAEIMYRVYVPDTGRDPSGDGGLPEASMKLPTGDVVEQPLTCQPRDSNTTLDELHANGDSGGVDPDDPTTEDPIRWEAFFNYAQAFSYPLGATPAASARSFLPREKLGGFLSNIDNAYTLATANRGKGPVLVLEGRAPITPRTLDGRPLMEAGDVRYWSLCENEFASQRVIDCVYDEQVAADAETGRYTVVMSTPGERPANAWPECGVNWIRWGAQPNGLLILRHMLPSAGFAHAIQNVSELGTEREVMGDYLPVGTHTTRAAFEARGCATPAVPAG